MPEELDDIQLEALLFPPPPSVAAERRPMPDWAVVHRELRRPNITLSLLWNEYRGGTRAQDGFGYSWFCDLYREWVGRLKPTLHQVHTAGERVFVDFVGHAMEVIDGATGEVCRAEVFVAVLGASSYTFAEAVWTQSLPDWIAAHVAMLAFIGGAPRQIVSDNLRAGITRACFYEPLVNRTYADMASHYGTAVVPARPYRPRDKAKVEVGVQVVQRWILARLRNQRFFSLGELNQAIRELVDQLNDRPMRGWGATRRALYEQVDRPALRELPPTPYEYADWKPAPRKHPRPRLLPLKGETMLTHPLAERLRGLGMAAMADAFLEMQTTSAAADLTREDWLGLLLDREVTARDNKRLGRRLRQARLRQNAVVEDTDFRTPRGHERLRIVMSSIMRRRRGLVVAIGGLLS